MAYKKKTGGRQKNTPNRVTKELRETIKSFVVDNWSEVQKNFDKLEPLEKLRFLEKMIKYILPAPLNELEQLTDSQLDELIKKLKSGQI